MLILRLARLDSAKVKGIYTVGGVPDRLPERALFLTPDAADSFLRFLADRVVVSDMFRTAEASLAAVKAKRGAQPPGYSAHNYGIAIDIDVSKALASIPGVWTSKASLDNWMESHGWYCHRRDHKRGMEDWHYTFLGVGASVSPKVRTLAAYTEAEIIRRFGEFLAPDDKECQRMLRKLGLYRGDVDGVIGPQSRAAIGVFQRGWNLPPSGKLDTRTKRTLAYVSVGRDVPEGR